MICQRLKSRTSTSTFFLLFSHASRSGRDFYFIIFGTTSLAATTLGTMGATRSRVIAVAFFVFDFAEATTMTTFNLHAARYRCWSFRDFIISFSFGNILDCRSGFSELIFFFFFSGKFFVVMLFLVTTMPMLTIPIPTTISILASTTVSAAVSMRAMFLGRVMSGRRGLVITFLFTVSSRSMT